MSEVDSIVWPNPEFDNNITVHGPEVKALVQRYLTQMIRELSALPNPDGDRLAAEGRRSRRAPPGQQDDGHSLRQGRRPSARAALLQHRARRQHVLGVASRWRSTTPSPRASSTGRCGCSRRASAPAPSAATWCSAWIPRSSHADVPAPLGGRGVRRPDGTPIVARSLRCRPGRAALAKAAGHRAPDDTCLRSHGSCSPRPARQAYCGSRCRLWEPKRSETTTPSSGTSPRHPADPWCEAISGPSRQHPRTLGRRAVNARANSAANALSSPDDPSTTTMIGSASASAIARAGSAGGETDRTREGDDAPVGMGELRGHRRGHRVARRRHSERRQRLARPDRLPGRQRRHVARGDRSRRHRLAGKRDQPGGRRGAQHPG